MVWFWCVPPRTQTGKHSFPLLVFGGLHSEGIGYRQSASSADVWRKLNLDQRNFNSEISGGKKCSHVVSPSSWIKAWEKCRRGSFLHVWWRRNAGLLCLRKEQDANRRWIQLSFLFCPLKDSVMPADHNVIINRILCCNFLKRSISMTMEISQSACQLLPDEWKRNGTLQKRRDELPMITANRPFVSGICVCAAEIGGWECIKVCFLQNMYSFLIRGGD